MSSLEEKVNSDALIFSAMSKMVLPIRSLIKGDVKMTKVIPLYGSEGHQ